MEEEINAKTKLGIVTRLLKTYRTVRSGCHKRIKLREKEKRYKFKVVYS